MELGNNVFEIFICQGIELALTLLNFEVSLSLKENHTLFRND